MAGIDECQSGNVQAAQRSSLCYCTDVFSMVTITIRSMTYREMVNEYFLDNMTDEQIGTLVMFLSYCNEHVCYRELREWCELDKNVDTAIPQSWFDEVEALGINPRGFVWSYKDKSFGEPIKVNDVFLDKLCKILNINK